MGRSILKLVPWDVWAALAVAAMVLVLAAFNQSPLLKFVLVGLVLWAYIAIQNRPRYRDQRIASFKMCRRLHVSLPVLSDF
jgi:type IV secretory pathway VirB3-like protein